MSSSRKTINELASMFQDHVNWLGRYGSVPRRMALRIVNVQAGEVLDRIPRLLALERVVRRISWQWMHEAWDVVTGMTCESPRECAGTRKPIPSGMGGFTMCAFASTARRRGGRQAIGPEGHRQTAATIGLRTQGQP